ncbi:MOSC domain-containing protein [Citrus sinensis]|nr:MOSC domain-containing protein [Citrus sinensis]
MEAAAKVKSIFVYPIKSCRGISVCQQAPLTPTGFRWDRQWMVINNNGRAYTQRNEPKLALVETELPNEAFLEGWEPTGRSFMDGVSVWEWCGSALAEGAEASNWFTNYLGKPSRLVRYNAESETRPVDPKYAAGEKIMFSDCYPFMLLSQGSLDALNKLLKEPIPINRFRPNILVDGCEPFSEDLWTGIRINNCTFQGVKLCDRCKVRTVVHSLRDFPSDTSICIHVFNNTEIVFQVPTINQDTGVAGPEPSETLRQIRSDKVLRPNQKQQGKNLVWKDNLSNGKVLKLGDPVFVMRKVNSAAEAAA